MCQWFDSLPTSMAEVLNAVLYNHITNRIFRYLWQLFVTIAVYTTLTIQTCSVLDGNKNKPYVRVIRPWVVHQPVLNSSPLLSPTQGITTASPPPPTPLRLHLMVRGYLRMAPSPLNTWTRASPQRSSSSSATLQDLASRLSGETLTDFQFVVIAR